MTKHLESDTKKSDEDKKIGFTVDTHLFRELGELLVGRESTALIELIKNSYDADATMVTVIGERLGDSARGKISIIDNGNGMDSETFRRGFLRIASRMKSGEARKSPLYKRRFTGAKGIGRLAAHKLARMIGIESIPAPRGSSSVESVSGAIDWDKVEAAETLDDISSDAITLDVNNLPSPDSHGTTLTLTRLRTKWTPTQRSRFLREVDGLRPPAMLIKQSLPKTLAPEGTLFAQPRVFDASRNDPGFDVKLEGDFETGESYWPVVLEAATWLLEIDASSKRVKYRIAPTQRAKEQSPDIKCRTFSEPHPDGESGPFFHARIFVREGAPAGTKDMKAWASRLAGVRVYMEGFRVLPYGEDSDDWLSLTRDTTDRNRKLKILEESSLAASFEDLMTEGLLQLPNKHYFGGVFLTTDRAPTLEMLVNREGFVPNHSFETLVRLVRLGIDLSTRFRAAHRSPKSSRPSTPVPAQHNSQSTQVPVQSPFASVRGAIAHLETQAVQLQKIADSAPGPVAESLKQTAMEISKAAATSRNAIPASSMILVLASVGTQLAAFTHEVNHLLSIAGDTEALATSARETEGLPPAAKRKLNKVATASADLRRALERQAAYLIDVVTPDARRRRSKLPVREILETSWKLVATTAEQRKIKLVDDVNEDARTPLMFRAELLAVFSNLLTNAVKASDKNGRIRASSEQQPTGLQMTLENTGVAVDLGEAERWFHPFESTTVDVDPVLGQGMGLGLSITRDLLAEIGATIRFVRPNRGYATAIQISFPEKK